MTSIFHDRTLSGIKFSINHIPAGVLENQDTLDGGGQIAPPPNRNRVNTKVQVIEVVRTDSNNDTRLVQ